MAFWIAVRQARTKNAPGAITRIPIGEKLENSPAKKLFKPLTNPEPDAGSKILFTSSTSNTGIVVPYTFGPVRPKIEALPKNSLTIPINVSAMVKPSPIPIPSNMDGSILFLDA